MQYANAASLIERLTKAGRENKLEERIKALAKLHLLISDEMGYLQFNSEGAHCFFSLISRRYDQTSPRFERMAATTNFLWTSIPQTLLFCGNICLSSGKITVPQRYFTIRVQRRTYAFECDNRLDSTSGLRTQIPCSLLSPLTKTTIGSLLLFFIRYA